MYDALFSEHDTPGLYSANRCTEPFITFFQEVEMKTHGLGNVPIIIMVTVAMLIVPVVSALALTITNEQLISSGAAVFSDSGAEAFNATDKDATAFLFLEQAGFKNSNTFGIYTYDYDVNGEVSARDTLQIFSGANSPFYSNTLTFNFATGTITTASEAIAMSAHGFGFYLTSPEQTYYSHASLNSDGFDHFLAYDTRDSSAWDLFGSDFVLAIEDFNGGGDADFNDMVVGISDVAPVPEPGTLILLGVGLLGLAYVKKRQTLIV